MTEVLTIRVEITQTNEVNSESGCARMILFEGDCDHPNFKGKILPGGVDTQKEIQNRPFALSARYILKGVDCDGQECSIFIENNGTMVDDEVITHPIVITDSKALAYLEKAELTGTIEGWEKGVYIHIWN